jgi:hypothetical protein
LQRQPLQPNRCASAAELKATVIEPEIIEADRFLWHNTTPALIANCEGGSDVQMTRYGASLWVQKFCSAGFPVSSPFSTIAERMSNGGQLGRTLIVRF